MKIKSFLREMTPPIIWRLKDFYKERSSIKEYKKLKNIYTSYAAALEHCITKEGYEDNDVVKTVFEKTKIFKEQINNASPIYLNSTEAFAFLGFLRLTGNTALNIIDLGGACGLYYLYYKQLVKMSTDMKWFVVETTQMCRYGKTLENHELQFRDDFERTLEEVKMVDLLLCSGTLQCVERPYELLELMAESNAEFILFNRLGLTEGDTDVITTHVSNLSDNGIGVLPKGFTDKKVEYPFSFIQKAKFDTIMQANYDYKIIWSDQSGIFPVNDEPIVGMGILCERKTKILKSI